MAVQKAVTQTTTVPVAAAPVQNTTKVQKSEQYIPISSATLPPPASYTTKIIESPPRGSRIMYNGPPQSFRGETISVRETSPVRGGIVERSYQQGPGFRMEERTIQQGMPLVSDRYLQGRASGQVLPGIAGPTVANTVSYQNLPPLPNIMPPNMMGQMMNSYTGVANSMDGANRPSFGFLAPSDSQGPSILGTNTYISEDFIKHF